MMTYEMVGIADQNGRTYKSKYGKYNKEHGFLLSEDYQNIGKCELIDKLFHENCWSLEQKPKRMTKEEIEKELGYKIDIQDCDDNTKPTLNTNFADSDVMNELLFNFFTK